ncbi:hypothetical protein ACKFKF_15245 [Phormidesmis sp. 146-12]
MNPISSSYPQGVVSSLSGYVQEWADGFLALFPHRYDYIWAEHPNPGAKVEWKTETRHPLSDRLIHQGSYLYGVRFGAETRYCLLDIDAGSAYHPTRDPFAISRIVAALEPLGLVRHIACTSSYSGGLHLYFPFPNAQSSWQLAIALATLLENAGFKLNPGQLEVFPNPKPYLVEGTPSLFNAHRLPLQAGSYLLNSELQPIWSTQQVLVEQWNFTQNCNDLETKLLKQILKQAKRKFFRISGKADKFINDLNAEIELGWTGRGQTNRLLGRITMRSYIFQHILSGGKPLEGLALIEEIVETAKSLPGYQEWCQHQHEIEHRAAEWATCIENSRYFHYGDPNGKFKAKSEKLEQAIEQAPTWNQQRSQLTRDRIRSAIADLLETGLLPSNATARFKALLGYKIGGGSLYRHRDLWHPSYLTETAEDFIKSDEQPDCVLDATDCSSLTSLLSDADGNHSPDNGSSDSVALEQGVVDGNVSSEGGSASLQGVQFVQQTLAEIQAQRSAQREAAQIASQHQQQIKREVSNAKLVARMQQFLASGDPILVAEALAWADINPGVLDISSHSLQNSSQAAIEVEGERHSSENDVG